MLVTKKGDLKTLIVELKAGVKFLAEHLFRADWQHRQFTVNHYVNRCPGCQETTTESLVFISSDRKHDHHAVHHFTVMALTHLRNQRGLTVSHVNQWTDGCSAQYKSRGPFADIACSMEDMDATLERNFYGSRHGKGASDGESAVVKHHAATAVSTGRAVITSAAELFSYCENSPLNKQPPVEGCAHHLRTYFWVGDDDIERDRPVRSPDGQGNEVIPFGEVRRERDDYVEALVLYLRAVPVRGRSLQLPGCGWPMVITEHASSWQTTEVTPSSSTAANEGPNQWRLSQIGHHSKRMSQ